MFGKVECVVLGLSCFNSTSESQSLKLATYDNQYDQSNERLYLHNGPSTPSTTFMNAQPLRPEVRQHLLKYMVLVVSIIMTTTHTILQTMYPKDPEPYHTSALFGQDWVLELLAGHAEHICCKLGMHADAFMELISELRIIGHSDSKFVSLEEQLAIFLYTSVTGLPIRHVGERFQWLNETISW